MAVVETYAESALNSFDKTTSTLNGNPTKKIVASVEVLAADDDGSKYILGVVEGNNRPIDIVVFNDAITGGTDYDIGLYLIDSDRSVGAVVDVNLFADGLDLSSAGDKTFALTAPDIANIGSTVEELLAAASVTANVGKGQYYLVLTANTVGTAAGTITVIYESMVD